MLFTGRWCGGEFVLLFGGRRVGGTGRRRDSSAADVRQFWSSPRPGEVPPQVKVESPIPPRRTPPQSPTPRAGRAVVDAFLAGGRRLDGGVTAGLLNLQADEAVRCCLAVGSGVGRSSAASHRLEPIDDRQRSVQKHQESPSQQRSIR